MHLPSDQAGWRKLCESVLAEERALEFEQFSYDDAWALGSAMSTNALSRALPVAIAV